MYQRNLKQKIDWIRIVLSLFFFLLIFNNGYSQGFNHTWLLSYNFSATSLKARFNFSSSASALISEQRKMPFQGTEGNISDSQGNFLMSSNGLWIANSTGDTMMNGSGLNPNSFTSTYPGGLTIPNGNVFLPYPGDSTKYLLFHQTGNNNAQLASTEVYYSIIDITLDNGLGSVISKNNIALSDTLGWGLGACKHANGRDWWVVAISINSNTIHKFLATNSGVTYMGNQTFSFPAHLGIVCQPVFSPDGKKFGYTACQGDSNGNWSLDLRLFDFDRCSGIFSIKSFIDLSNVSDSLFGFSTAFSSNSKYLYAASVLKVFQINTDSTNVPVSLTTVAVNDSFASPFPPWYTNFNLMYLAANGKIYITSGGSVQALHVIDQPDSDGLACSVLQHSIALPCWHFRNVPNHPNYYLGCDTTSSCQCLITSLDEQKQNNFNFSVSPNPTNRNITIVYHLPQNESGAFDVYDINGRKIFSQLLPQWSTMQNILLPELSNGIYNCSIVSDQYRTNKKIVIVN